MKKIYIFGYSLCVILEFLIYPRQEYWFKFCVNYLRIEYVTATVFRHLQWLFIFLDSLEHFGPFICNIISADPDTGKPLYIWNPQRYLRTIQFKSVGTVFGGS